MDHLSDLRDDLRKYYADDPEERDNILAYLPEQPAGMEETAWLLGIVRDILHLATNRGDYLRIAIANNKRLRAQLPPSGK